MEVMATVAIIGVLASLAIPNFQKAVRRGRLRAALDVLRTIAAGEQVYFTLNGEFSGVPLFPSDTPDHWKIIFMDSPNIGFPNTPTGLIFGDIASLGLGGAPPPKKTSFEALAYISNPLVDLVLQLFDDGSVNCIPKISGAPVGEYTAEDCP